MTPAEIVRERMAFYERFTQDEFEKQLEPFHISFEYALKHHIIAPTNEYFQGERFYVLTKPAVDIHENLPLSDKSNAFRELSYMVPNRVEKLFYEWAKKRGISIELLKMAWQHSSDPLYDIVSDLLGKTRDQIFNYLDRHVKDIQKATFEAKVSQAHNSYYYALSLEAWLRHKNKAFSNKIRLAKKNLIIHVFKDKQTDSIDKVLSL